MNLRFLKIKYLSLYVCVTVMVKFTNYWLLLCRVSYILPYILGQNKWVDLRY